MGRFLPFYAIIIPIKDTRIPFLHQQDQTVGGRFEPILHLRLQRTVFLGIMVIHEGDGLIRAYLDQGPF